MYDRDKEINMFNLNGSKARKKKCVICGKEFVTQLPSKKTCSVECSMQNKQNYQKTLCTNNKRYYSDARKSKNKVRK